MSTVSIEPLLHHHHHHHHHHHCRRGHRFTSPNLFNLSSFTAFPKKPAFRGRSFITSSKTPKALKLRASANTAVSAAVDKSTEAYFNGTFPINRTEVVEGKIFVKLDKGKNERNWLLTVGCTLPGKWILHWGVTLVDDVGSEWDQPPEEMWPPGSIPVKEYAVETPLAKSSSSSVGGDGSHEVKIDFNLDGAIAAINFVLKDEETGSWYQHKGRDFKVPLVGYLQEEGNVVGAKKGLGILPGALGKLSNMFVKQDSSQSQDQDSSIGSRDTKEETMSLEGFYEELPIAKEIAVNNSVTVSVKKCPETAKNLIYLETDLPDYVVLHWGVCKDDAKIWEIPSSPLPPQTVAFKDNALRTQLQKKEGGKGCWGLFTLEEGPTGFLFVFKLNESTWLKCMGNDFCIPLLSSNNSAAVPREDQSEVAKVLDESAEAMDESTFGEYADGIINEIRTLVSGISSEKRRKTKSKEAQEIILQEIEKLAAEAYSIFRSTVPTIPEEAILESEELPTEVKITSGTGTGYEILCQGFNWESHKSGKWYKELKDKAADLSSLGFTVIWLPPPTDSVSPEGYMPKDLYNMNSRYGTMEELKDTVKAFHNVGIKVLGDAVLNHRCAEYQNENGIWNKFGGRLNWDARAVVADDPHFQGRGNKSSGDSFHAAPNIDHSQDFVRKDIKEWLCWLRHEVGYDGWRLDFVRGFWGGYVKDYMDASEPYFSVGEYWDSLSYTYGEMDHNQDAHRQRIVDWINAAGGTAGAFDVTTKGILHGALERCEYWRLSDEKGQPPGVVGWWPSRAVTFIENHDTGSTQGHWRFPNGKEMQGYAYTLTHPGTPAVFWDHIFSHHQPEIGGLIALRNRNKINCRSRVIITKSERDVYAAIIDKKVAMMIGPGHYEPPNGQSWSKVLEGRDYKVWETS